MRFVQSLYAAFGRGDFARPLPAHRKNVDRSMTGRRSEHPTLGEWQGVRKGFFADVAKYEETIEFSPREFHASHEAQRNAGSSAQLGLIPDIALLVRARLAILPKPARDGVR
jgi:hypothetical protein